ncbi:hypothetical protein X474_09680 [Dethiosulfatarculus sandiegensis]|uniref:Uncharacterized protein n=1 Tax=Dethiosulfatarculus sandiegensis TaxID=1429043 RepID=A0A0D2HVJ0_9BACT|nr:hypothetical protein X474_09680 [Dethiosulfatarculus sandiegensis]
MEVNWMACRLLINTFKAFSLLPAPDNSTGAT